MGSRIQLRSLLMILTAAAFVTLLIGFTGDVSRLWPLYGIPIVTAALAYHTPGAVVTTAAAAALIVFLGLEAGIPITDDVFAQSAVGLAVFLVSGVTVGVLMRRHELHEKELERVSVYDPMTGLYSSSYLSTRLDEEMRRTNRYGENVGLIILDLDGLKAFNETFGTPRGDLLLAHVAEILRMSLRNTDVLAREDGGRFAVILPHCGETAAADVAERLREAVEAADFEGDELQPVTKHTISLGVSAFPAPATDKEGLISIAETGLRAAKEHGRNRVEVAYTDDAPAVGAAGTDARPAEEGGA